MKINEMFKKIESNTAQPQSVWIENTKITQPSEHGLEEYSKVTGLISTTDGASDCFPDSANH